jgi:hypothetical protein
MDLLCLALVNLVPQPGLVDNEEDDDQPDFSDEEDYLFSDADYEELKAEDGTYTVSLFFFHLLLNHSQDKFVYIRPHLERVVSTGFLLEWNCAVSFEAMRFK